MQKINLLLTPVLGAFCWEHCWSRPGSNQNETHIQIKLTFNENTLRDHVMTEKAIECLYACTIVVAAVLSKKKYRCGPMIDSHVYNKSRNESRIRDRPDYSAD
jgi:hypothetical protein